ncbi:hypothetical protein [Mesorhizobium sp. J428]|nr:hypothetical protein [Mesorhizobium sp. J428]
MTDKSMMMLMMAGIILGALLVLAILILGLFALVKYLRGSR